MATGLAAAVTDKVTATLNAVSTFGRADGNDYGLSAGIKVAF